jgi:hypothetical protein
MPARPRHAVTVIVKISVKPPQVLGLFNASTIDMVNYMHTDPTRLLRVREFVLLPVACVVIAAWFGDAGMVLLVLAAVGYLLTAFLSRAINQALWARRVDHAMIDEAAKHGWRFITITIRFGDKVCLGWREK